MNLTVRVRRLEEAAGKGVPEIKWLEPGDEQPTAVGKQVIFVAWASESAEHAQQRKERIK
jgi:hypothetical protein